MVMDDNTVHFETDPVKINENLRRILKSRRDTIRLMNRAVSEGVDVEPQLVLDTLFGKEHS